MTAISLIGLCGFLALSIDLGMLAVARPRRRTRPTRPRRRRRSLNGSTDRTCGEFDRGRDRSGHAQHGPGNTSLASRGHGCPERTYHYNYASQTFHPGVSAGTNENYNLTQVTITHTYTTTFADVIGVPTHDGDATSTAAHRPRDVAMVLDYSGSMNNESDLWNCESYLGLVL